VEDALQISAAAGTPSLTAGGSAQQNNHGSLSTKSFEKPEISPLINTIGIGPLPSDRSTLSRAVARSGNPMLPSMPSNFQEE